MGKNANKNETVTVDGVTDPELLFCDDALVVDYLNALLTSEPALNMDFREIHFVHQAARAGWKSTGIDNSLAGTSIMIETGFSKNEADVLRSENENLKYKTELAAIDTHVLRSENNNLKVEIARLMAQLNEVECKLQATRVQNSDLRSSIETGHRELNVSTTSVESITEHVHADSEPYLEETAETSIEADSELVVTHELVDVVIDQKEKPELDFAAQHNSGAGEISRELSPDPVVVVQEYRRDDTARPAIDPERSILSHVDIENDRKSQKNNYESAIFSRKNAVEKMPIQSARPVSKVIKRQHTEKFQDDQQTGNVLKATSINSYHPGKNYNETGRKPNSVQQQHVTEVVHKQNEDPASHTLTQIPDVADEINLESTPAPKVVVRRNVKNYEDLQKESDSANTTVSGHTIVL